MPKITPNQNFKHKGQQFEKDKEYDVSIEDYGYFKGVGWAGERVEAGPQEQTLEIHDSMLGHASEVN